MKLSVVLSLALAALSFGTPIEMNQESHALEARQCSRPPCTNDPNKKPVLTSNILYAINLVVCFLAITILTRIIVIARDTNTYKGRILSIVRATKGYKGSA
ncbi:hypothetical protein GQ44DRAFT_734538 [Phaeosphaeriaceae sp. PMI808]|nr:hypothetical protein GQ44DRAFT_734538 [Phaeosphaeriaceae sp. PMI808]